MCLVFGIGLFLGVGSGFAQEGYNLWVKVPFAFTAGNSHFEGGEFLINESSNGPTMLRISSQDGTEVACIFTTGMMPDNASVSKPRVIFHKYRDRYFLSQIWYGDGSGGCQLLPTKAEEETAISATAMNLKPTVIEIAAR